MAWQHIFPLATPAEDILETYTKAIVQNNLYIYRTDLPHIIHLDFSVPGQINPVAIVPSFLNMAALEGIVSGRSRLVAWDDENQFYWSDTDTIGSTTLNFTPSLETRANTVPVDAMKGNVVHCVETLDGFVVYTTANIIKADFTPQDSQNLFTFREITDNVGIFSKKQVTFGEEGTHYAYTNGGLYRVDTTARKVEPIAPDISDYITAFQQPPRLSYHLDRFLVISLPEEGVDFGRTARQRHFEDGSRYFRDRSSFDFPANFDRTLFPEGFDFNDGFPIPCEDSVPDNCDTNILWGAFLQRFPRLEIEEKVLVNVLDVIDNQGGTPPNVFLPHKIGPDTSAVNLFTPAPIDIPYFGWTQETIDRINTKGFGLEVFPRYSFDPMALMLHQAYIWQETDQFNRLNAAIMEDQKYTFIMTPHEFIESTPGGIELVSTEVEIDNNITKDSKTISIQSTQEKLEGVPGIEEPFYHSILEDRGVIRITNIRTTIEEILIIGGDSTRTTTVERFYIDVNGSPVLGVKAFDATGEFDGTINQEVDIDIPIPSDAANNGLTWLTKQNINFWEDDDYFKTHFFVQGDTNYQPVATLAPEIPLDQIIEFWSTGRTIVAQTDRCTFANIRSFLSRRAVSDGIVKHAKTTSRFRYIKSSSITGIVAGLYYFDVEQEISFNYGSGTEVQHNDILTLPGPDIPLIAEIEPAPLAKITGRGNPQRVLEEYYQEAESRGLSILDIYEEHGWTVEAPPPSLPFAKQQLLLASPPSGDIVNGKDNTTLFSEFFNSGTVCGEDFPAIVIPNFDPVVPQAIIPVTEPIPEIVVPETIFLTQTGQPGELFPTYTRALIFDRHLRKWGTANLNHKIFLDISPINEVVYDPILNIGVTRFTFDNFLRRLGALLDNGMIVLFDDSPKDSYIVYGKIGYNRQGFTRMHNVKATFAEHPNAAIILESSLDGRFLDPYNLVTGPAIKAGVTLPANVSANWFNIVIRGRYHVTQLSFDATSQGKR